MYTRNDARSFYIPSNYRGNALYFEQLGGEECDGKREDKNIEKKDADHAACRHRDNAEADGGECSAVCRMHHDPCQDKKDERGAFLTSVLGRFAKSENLVLIALLVFLLLGSADKDKDTQKCDDNILPLLLILLLL